MKLSWRSLFAWAGMLLASASVQAEEVSLKPKFEPFNGPEVTLVGHNCADGCADACANSCTDSCTSCCPSRHVGRDFFVCKDRCGGWVGGIDFLLIKPYAAGGIVDNDGTVPPAATSTLNFGPAYRIYFGRQNAEGLGARMRYFEYDRGSATGADGTSFGFEARYLDAELTQVVDFRRWDLLISGGLRYAEIQADRILNTGTAMVGAESGFDGFGLTFGVQATRDLNKSGSLQFVSSARWSAVYGNGSSTFGAITGTPGDYYRDNLANILEINIGPQYRRCLRNGGYLTLGAGLEAQYWSNALPTDTFATAGMDAGLAGFSTTIAVTR